MSNLYLVGGQIHPVNIAGFSPCGLCSLLVPEIHFGMLLPVMALASRWNWVTPAGWLPGHRAFCPALSSSSPGRWGSAVVQSPSLGREGQSLLSLPTCVILGKLPNLSRNLCFLTFHLGVYPSVLILVVVCGQMRSPAERCPSII